MKAITPPHPPPPPYTKTWCPSARGTFDTYPAGSYYDTCYSVYWVGDTGSGTLRADCNSQHGRKANILDVTRCCKVCEKNSGNDKHWTDVILWNDNGKLKCVEPQEPNPQGCP